MSHRGCKDLVLPGAHPLTLGHTEAPGLHFSFLKVTVSGGHLVVEAFRGNSPPPARPSVMGSLLPPPVCDCFCSLGSLE